LEQLPSLIAICEGYFSEPWTKFENFTEAYEPVQSVCTPLWNSLNRVTNERTDEHLKFEAPGKEISASRNNVRAVSVLIVIR